MEAWTEIPNRICNTVNLLVAQEFLDDFPPDEVHNVTKLSGHIADLQNKIIQMSGVPG